MQLEFALFCEAAEVTPDGVVHILHGGYDLVSASGFPVTLPRMVLVVRLLCEPSEFDREHVMITQLIDPQGKVLPVEMKIAFTPFSYPGHRDRKNRMTLRLDYVNLSFPEPGEYVFQFLADGVEIGHAQLDLRKKQATE